MSCERAARCLSARRVIAGELDTDCRSVRRFQHSTNARVGAQQPLAVTAPEGGGALRCLWAVLNPQAPHPGPAQSLAWPQQSAQTHSCHTPKVRQMVALVAIVIRQDPRPPCWFLPYPASCSWSHTDMPTGGAARSLDAVPVQPGALSAVGFRITQTRGARVRIRSRCSPTGSWRPRVQLVTER